MINKNKSKYLKIFDTVKDAGDEAAKKWQKFERSKGEIKSLSQIVTKVDTDTEKQLVKGIKKFFPDHAFLGEEYGRSKNKSDYVWIIDPIDGTTNFTIHNPLWSISVGLAYKDEIIFGLIYIPLLGEVFYSIKDKGSYLNKQKLKLGNKIDSKKQIHTFCHGDRKKDLIFATKYYRERKLSSLDCRQLGSAAIELCFVAAGRVDSIVIPGAKTWDIAAGALIAKEAGALTYGFDFKKWNLKSDGIICCHKNAKAGIFKTIKKIS
ncbi:MAG: inositol monophosphatase [Patescibacteria group bacterium]|jgi:myo-inositol-1(or 4)-monophosphatase|nr:inositol monophosphatase [Patescibacteria group bacterium]